MKIWLGYGSEHSTNLVMIGTFKDAADAKTAHDVIEKLTEVVQKEVDAGRLQVGEPRDKYSEEILDAVMRLNVHSIGPRELEQFQYDVTVRRKGEKIVIRTDENDVQAFVKLLIGRGARLEMYSAHDYPEDK